MGHGQLVIGNGWGRVYEIVGFRQLFLVKPAPTGCKLPIPDAQFPMPMPHAHAPCPITKCYFGP